MDLWHDYFEIISDPAHGLAELTYMLFDALVLTFILKWVRRRWLRRDVEQRVREEHHRIEEEHNLQHPKDSKGGPIP